MSVDIEKVRKAAELYQRHHVLLDSTTTDELASWESFPAWAVNVDVLARWAIEELARRDSEAKTPMALVSKLRNYDYCSDNDVDEAASVIERLAALKGDSP